MLNRRSDVEDVTLVVVDTAEVVVKSERVLLTFDKTRLPQDKGLLVIIIIPEPT